jgi:hypothetical protein
MYVPFLKLKKNEILSLRDLNEIHFARVTPFFDVPRIKDMGVNDFKTRINAAQKDLNKHWQDSKYFYLDTFDIDQDLRPDGVCPYAYAMERLKSFNIIPVVGLDRDIDHLNYVESYLSEIETKRVAIRLLPPDFEDYELIEDDLEDILGGIISVCDRIHLVLDCRVIAESNASDLAQNAAEFANTFCADYSCERVIVTGSSISASIADILPTNSETYITRYEPQIWNEFNSLFEGDLAEAVFGDYGIISPEYSDSDLAPEILVSVMAPKAIYSLNNQHYAVRGR